MSADDFFGTLNGFDEIAIARAFDAEIDTLRKRPFTFLRALVFIDQRRRGKTDAEAKTAALEVTMSDLGDYFPDPEPEIDPDDPVTDAGKDDTPSA